MCNRMNNRLEPYPHPGPSGGRIRHKTRMIATFYHCWLGERDQGVAILAEQMQALQSSGLADECGEIHLCGSGGDILLASALCPEKTQLENLGREVASEIPTIALLQQWSQGHDGDQVLYFHAKGASHPGDPYAKWRRCMNRAVIWNWRECVRALQAGFDTAGAHWMTSRRFPMMPPNQRYWGGNFWWANTRYLNTLPPVDSFSRYEAEIWIGRTDMPIRTLDLANHFPQNGCL